MHGEITKDIEIRGSSALLWVGVLLPPITFMLDLGFRYAIVGWACRHQAGWVLAASTVASVALDLVAAWCAWSGLQAQTGTQREDKRISFMGWGGISLAAFFILVSLSSVVPHLFIGACD